MRFKAVVYTFMVTILACNNPPEDVVPPEILRFELNAHNLNVGEVLEVQVEVVDDEELNQMRIRIREAFAKSFGHWAVVDIINIQGLTHSATYPYSIPDSSLAGLYEVSFQVVDMRGNASVDSLLTFFIGQPGLQPDVDDFTTIPAPDEGTVVVPGDGFLTFEGMVTDANGLGEVRIEFRDRDGRSIRSDMYNLADSVPVLSWNAAEASDTVFIQSFPRRLERIVVKALSTDGHQSRKSINVSIFP